MKRIKLIKSGFAAVLCVAIGALLSACNKDKGVTPTIAQIAVSMKGFSQLEAAAIKGNLAIVLSNPNPAPGSSGAYTVFAPTNEAFAKIGLVNPQDLNGLQQSFLVDVLKYHTSNGISKRATYETGLEIPSLLSPTKRVVMRGTDAYVNGSKIIAADVKADNGEVQVVDRVLLASGLSIAQTATFFAQGKGFVKPELSFLVQALAYAELTDDLSDANANFTVFAPTNQAFKDLGKILGVAINQPEDIKKLSKDVVTKVLLTHVFTQQKFTSELNSGSLNTLSGASITLGAYDNGYLTVQGAGNAAPANMVIPDVQCTNGIVHIIDRVLLPVF